MQEKFRAKTKRSSVEKKRKRKLNKFGAIYRLEDAQHVCGKTLKQESIFATKEKVAIFAEAFYEFLMAPASLLRVMSQRGQSKDY